MAESKGLWESQEEGASEPQVFIRKTNIGLGMNKAYGEGRTNG